MHLKVYESTSTKTGKPKPEPGSRSDKQVQSTVYQPVHPTSTCGTMWAGSGPNTDARTLGWAINVCHR